VDAEPEPTTPEPTQPRAVKEPSSPLGPSDIAEIELPIKASDPRFVWVQALAFKMGGITGTQVDVLTDKYVVQVCSLEEWQACADLAHTNSSRTELVGVVALIAVGGQTDRGRLEEVFGKCCAERGLKLLALVAGAR
jgi:hypothetical protein